MNEREFLDKCNEIVLRKETEYITGLLNDEIKFEEEWMKAERDGDFTKMDEAQKKVVEIYVKVEDECMRLDTKRAFDEEEFIIGAIEINRRLDELDDLLNKDDE